MFLSQRSCVLCSQIVFQNIWGAGFKNAFVEKTIKSVGSASFANNHTSQELSNFKSQKLVQACCAT